MANRWKYMGHEIGGWVATNPEPVQKLVFKLDKYKWKGNGQYARLPEHYKQRAIEHLYGNKEDVHEVPDKRKFIVNHETGVWTRTKHVPVTVVPTVQADKGLWGGEGVLIGYEDGNVVDEYYRCFISVPKLMKLLFYSEILHQHYAICVTRRTIAKIEEATTLDHYILKTPLQDLNSKFGFDLRRQMLHKLVNNGENLWSDNPEKQRIIYEKYKQYQVPKEEIDWIGLLPDEALEKLENEEDEKYERSIRPWKELFRESLITELSRRQKNNEPIDITPVTTKPPPKTLKEKVINKLWGS
ncbi:unnamed protein product [Rotaria magnacalcarata]|uniref:39S ribosomal protein L28, mitochondrial n=1 Tax=Rotaria magnacalcarata TaxID=392030 RepID=A0A816R785_9BILA|nr:unnamed protein product [Rotaria magnacalcarata]CAF1665169.1 unnamed protein product [Rotaria magnacalcarata]CAF2062623.1 unnamed protein product [Rotaria magnacalcarata]CAF2071375.1 unnamed protein product [Rotaria magnacalcarata]CAF2264641.1 unnamed protein product [Rotaria magnacalcarata]